MRFDEGYVRLGSFRLNDDGLKLRQISRRVQLLGQIADGNPKSFGDGRKRLADQNGIVSKQQDAERWVVVYQNTAVAIQHAAAGSDDGNRADAIALRPLRVLVGIDDLEFPKTDEQHADHAHDHVGDHRQPRLRQSIIVAEPVRHENPKRVLPSAAAVQSPFGGLFAARSDSVGGRSRHHKIFSLAYELSASENFEILPANLRLATALAF